MNTNTNEVINSSTDEIVEVPVLAEDATEDQKTEYYSNLEKANKQLFARAKKGEGFELVDGKWVKPAKPAEQAPATKTSDESKGLSNEDMFTLIKADVAQEDISEVTDYAKLRNISIADALNSDIVKTILANKKEARRVADGTHTGDTTRSSGKLSDETLLSNAAKGIMPESDEDMGRLIELRRANN